MRTRCSGCQTTFRVTPEQLRARLGKVRCGQCLTVFNALDSLVEEETEKPGQSINRSGSLGALSAQFSVLPDIGMSAAKKATSSLPKEAVEPSLATSPSGDVPAPPLSAVGKGKRDEEPSEIVANEISLGIPDSASVEPVKTDAFVMPRETNEIPGYSKWTEGLMTAPAELSSTRQSSGFFLFSAFVFALILIAQASYHFRSEIAVAVPALRPILQQLGDAAGFDIPLPRRVELLSIESSDLQSDADHRGLLILNASLRNRASFAQAYPRIELTLTDTLDNALLRRALGADEYLTQRDAAALPFAANSEVAIRLWIDAREIAAAGYRLYVFYP